MIGGDCCACEAATGQIRRNITKTQLRTVRHLARVWGKPSEKRAIEGHGFISEKSNLSKQEFLRKSMKIGTLEAAGCWSCKKRAGATSRRASSRKLLRRMAFIEFARTLRNRI